MYWWASYIEFNRAFSPLAQKCSTVSGQILKLKKIKERRDSYVVVFARQNSALHAVYSHYIIEFDVL